MAFLTLPKGGHFANIWAKRPAMESIMNPQILTRAKDWVNNRALDESSRREIQVLIDKGDHKELDERFHRDLEFGTGGLRSILGAGTNRMNRYNIRKASHALAKIVKREPGPWKIAVSYDSRQFSEEFAKEASAVFAANGITALLYNRLNPVPLCSFAIRHHNCHAGVMVTASHNPPEYNGYKVFWADGAQVTPPYDKAIIDAYNEIADYGSIPFMDFNQALEKGLVTWLTEETEDAYFKGVLAHAIKPELCHARGQELKIVYTPIHGTGLIPCTRILKELGPFCVSVVEQQAQPDSKFPTVKSPNPENPDALALAVAQMERENADLAMGTDPDTDRVGVALKHEGRVQYLNGNQIGVLMLHYILSGLKESNRLPRKPYFVKTIVTTDLQTKIAESFGVQVENTLTGFKWICGRMNDIEKKLPELNFVFATEESFGYLNHQLVRDKDGVSSIGLMAEMALYHKTKGKNLFQAIDDIYEEYGFSHEHLVSIDYEGKEGAAKIDRIMETFRSLGETHLLGLKISQIEDYKKGEAKDSNGALSPINLPKSNVLGYVFENGNKLFLRPSGTEPKIKFYIMVREETGTLSEKKSRALALTNEFVGLIKAMADKA
jgi:phosphoglucomutase